MTGGSRRARREVDRWRLAPELPVDLYAVLRKPGRAIDPVAVVATVHGDGHPRTAPFGSLRTVTPGLLRLACARYYDTYANLCRDGRVSVCLLAPPDIAVSIRGQARVVKERMGTGEHRAVLAIDVEQVKNDMMRRGVIESGIGLSPPDDVGESYAGAIAEIEDT